MIYYLANIQIKVVWAFDIYFSEKDTAESSGSPVASGIYEQCP